MAITAVSGWSSTAASNVDLNSLDLRENVAAISDINNQIREMMAQLKTYFANGGTSALLSSPTITTPNLTSPVISAGTITEDIYTITDGAAFEIDPANGSFQSITLTASRTPKATNFVNGQAITLFVKDGTAYTLTWSDTTFGAGGLLWKDSSAATLDVTNWTAIVLFKWNNQVYGVSAGVYV